MNLKFLKTKEFKVKFVISIALLILFSMSFLFKNQLEHAFGLKQKYSINEISMSKSNESNYKVHYLDVGQGNCSIVELPDGKVMIIDGGSDMYGGKISDFLNSKNIRTIDYMIATHADADHIGGLNYLFENFEIINVFRPMQIAGTTVEETSSNGEVTSHFEVYENEDLKDVYMLYVSSKFVEVTSYRYREFIKNIYSETYYDDGTICKTNVTVFYDGLKIAGDNYEFEFYAPLKTEDEIDLSNLSNTNGYMTKIYGNDSSNNSSSIFLLEICGDKFFFSGDASAVREEIDNLTKFAENDFIESLTDDEVAKLAAVDVYLVAHHGSKYSSSFSLLNLIKPDFAVVSVGKNDYGHPSEEVLGRLDEINSLEVDGILLTSEQGNITFCSVSENVVFLLEKSSKQNELTIQLEYLLLIIFVVVEICVVYARPRIKKNKTD